MIIDAVRQSLGESLSTKINDRHAEITESIMEFVVNNSMMTEPELDQFRVAVSDMLQTVVVEPASQSNGETIVVKASGASVETLSKLKRGGSKMLPIPDFGSYLVGLVFNV